MRIDLATPGPAGHGVVRHAAALARLLRAAGAHVGGGADVVHTQFTDALWGPDVTTAATAFRRWADRAGRPLVVTLHDVPGGDPDPARDARRTRGYAAVVGTADAVVVAAEHEAAKVAAATGRRATVIGLPVETMPCGPVPAWADRPTLGVLGFVYPGKGHADVLAAAARRADRPRVVAAGAVSPGHAPLWSALVDQAVAAGVELLLTGPLDDTAMGAAARAVTVPVVPSATVSASATLATWWGSGRRPLVARGPFAAEQQHRRPDAVRLYDDPAGLDVAIDAALTTPQSTLLPAGLTWPDTAAEHLELYARVLAGAR